MRRSLGVVLAGAVLALGAAAPAMAQTPTKALEIAAENITAQQAALAGQPRTGADAGRLMSGDVVEYRLRFTNTTSGPVRDVTFEDPIPKGLVYVAGTAAADRESVVVEYSADGGRSFSAQPMAAVVIEGKEVMRPVPPELYTNIRWRITDSVDPNQQVSAKFRARLGAVARN